MRVSSIASHAYVIQCLYFIQYFQIILSNCKFCRYKLLATISDESGTLDAIAFSFVVEDLVERTNYLASQNMKVDAQDLVIPLDTAIGKTKLFYIGMSSTTSTFSIKYILKKSFNVESPNVSHALPDSQVILLFNMYCNVILNMNSFR
jgi:hypothetical protein